MTSCQKGYVTKCGTVDGKCKTYCDKGCWQGYNIWKAPKGQKCNTCCKKEPEYWYSRRTGTSYNSILDTGPLGHPRANGFSNVMFEKNVPVYLWLDNALKHGKGPRSCRYRCKGQGRLKCGGPATRTTPGSATSSKSVAPAMQSFETVLAIRKAQAYYDPANYRKSKKWKRANCRY